MKQQAEQSGRCPEYAGTLPECAPLAVPCVPLQQAQSAVYGEREALSQGTLYPALNLPFHLAVEGVAVADTPLTQLQALQFVLQELALYLDTHQDDTEAFSLFRQYSAMLETARAAYSAENAPLTRLETAEKSGWQWASAPWPWDEKGGN